jgi:radical SAM superfamily enzyme YgiQ (UPF0313 family)
MAYLASVLREDEHAVTIYNQDLHHYPDEHITDYLNKNRFDIVAVGSIAGYYPYKKLLSFSKAVNASINRKNFKYVLGGHMPSSDPEYFLSKTEADIVIKGEGEITFTNLTNDRIQEGQLVTDLDTLPFPAWDLFPMEYYRLQRMANIENNEFSMSMITGRGCSFHCTFCYRLTPGIRLRSVNNIVEEIKQLKSLYNISYIDFADDLTFASKQRTVELCEAFIKNDLNIKWRCEGRLNYTDSDILKLAKRAGCVFINYGIEALDDTVLANMKKALTVSQIIKGVEATIAEGISPGLNVIFGNVGDGYMTLNKAVDFLMKYDDGSQIRTIRPVTPYPGCELFDYAIKTGKLKDTADFYENKHVNSDLSTVNFTGLSDSEFHKALYDANLKLLNHYFDNKKISIEKQLNKLYLKRDVSFRGYRHM